MDLGQACNQRGDLTAFLFPKSRIVLSFDEQQLVVECSLAETDHVFASERREL